MKSLISKTFIFLCLTVVTVGTLAVGCGKAKTADTTAQEFAESAPDLDDLQLDDPSGTATQTGGLEVQEGALAVGEPALLPQLGHAIREELNTPILRLGRLVKRIAVATQRERCTDGFCSFHRSENGISYRLTVVRGMMAKNFIFAIRATNESSKVSQVVSWGHFHKVAAHQGAGRIVLRFTAMGEVDPTFKARGVALAHFNNAGAFKRLRLWLDQVDRNGDGETLTAGFGLMLKKGERGGKFRFMALHDVLAGNPGKELGLGRARWNKDGFGRGDAILVDPQAKQKLGELHECWDDARQLLWSKLVKGTTVTEVGSPKDCGSSLDKDETPPESSLGQMDEDPDTLPEQMNMVPEIPNTDQVPSGADIQ